MVIYNNIKKINGRRMNKKGFAFTMVILLVLALIVVYMMLHLPFPAFQKIKSIVNYVLIIFAWFLVQVGFILLYYESGKYVTKGFLFYRNKIRSWTINIKHFLISQK